MKSSKEAKGSAVWELIVESVHPNPAVEELRKVLIVNPPDSLVKRIGSTEIVPEMFTILKENYELASEIRDSKDLDQSLRQVEERAERLTLEIASFEESRRAITQQENARRMKEYEQQREDLVGKIGEFERHRESGVTGQKRNGEQTFQDLDNLMDESIDLSRQVLPVLDSIEAGFADLNLQMLELEVHFTKTQLKRYDRGRRLREFLWKAGVFFVNVLLIPFISWLVSGVIGLTWTGVLALIMYVLFNCLKYYRISPSFKNWMEEWRRGGLIDVSLQLGRARELFAVERFLAGREKGKS